MFCPNCGSELKDNNDLCLNCGWRREIAEVTTKKQIPIKAIVSIVIIIIILIIIYIVYMSMPPSFKNDGVGDYYKKSDGTYATNEWVKIKNNWYFFNQGGYLVKNSLTSDGYYVDEKGKMIKDNWKQLNGLYFYFGKNGEMTKNDWVEDNGKWYYLNNDGVMLKNTWVDGGYYVNSNGEMLKDTVTPDGIKVDKNGKSIKNDNNIEYSRNDSSEIKNDKIIKVTKFIYDKYNYAKDSVYNHKIDFEGKLWTYQPLMIWDLIDIYYPNGNQTTYSKDFSEESFTGEVRYSHDNEKISEQEYNAILEMFNDIVDYSANIIYENNEYNNTDYESVQSSLSKYNNDISVNITNNSLYEQSKNVKVVTEYSSDTLVDEMDTVTFGSYPQSDISGNIKEPIEWLVLEKNDSEMLLLSKYILDCKCYNDERKDVTWETCTLRQWLNNTFYNTAFNDNEKESIIKSNIINKDNSECGTLGGNDTNDYVYSLSIDECRKYFGNEDAKLNNKRLATKGTEYAKNIDNQGNKLDVCVCDDTEWYEWYEWSDENSDFWLRSPGCYQNFASFVMFCGNVDDGSLVSRVNNGLRPLIRVRYR